jgi:DNA-binding transcriptional regulator YhcF (GntR family)
MSREKGKKFAEKHESNAQINEEIKDQIINRTKNNELPCAVAHKIAAELNVSPAVVGKTADLTEMMLVKCQLGLFGYTPDKKIVKPEAAENPDLTSAIQDALVEGNLSCAKAWEIAQRFQVSKMKVSSVCEQLKIKIKPCQLGAF